MSATYPLTLSHCIALKEEFNMFVQMSYVGHLSPHTSCHCIMLNCNLPSYILHSHFCFRGHFFFLITLKYQCKTLSITESKVLHFLYMSFIKGRRHLMIFIFLAIYHNMMYTVCPILFLPFHPCYQEANLRTG